MSENSELYRLARDWLARSADNKVLANKEREAGDREAADRFDIRAACYSVCGEQLLKKLGAKK